MTMPRQILPNTRYLISRRCTQRQFLLKPSPNTNSIFLYCLAVAAEKYEVLVHCVDVLSNHYHANVTDVKGNIPEFMAYLHRLVATSLNVSLGRWENVWAVEQPSLVRLQDDEDVLRKMVYTMANPVISLLVPYGHQWPGLRTCPADLLKDAIEAPRPKVFFREDGNMPAVAQLKLTRPDIFPELSDEEFVELLTEAVEKHESEIRAEALAAGKRFLGLKRLRRQRHTDTPRSHAPRRKLRPRIAAINKWRRIEALQRLKEFIASYREAWLQWKQGIVDVVFPTGTYALAKNGSVTCAPP
jgi:REP-associated tyrosine transposase